MLCPIERRPPKLDLDAYPSLPRANVATTATASYMSCWVEARHDRYAATVAGPSPQDLKLPAFLREYDKLPASARRGRRPWLRYPVRLAELELIDRERRMAERRIRQARFPAVKASCLRLQGHPIAQQDAGRGAGAL